jgi:hypothetical protein
MKNTVHELPFSFSRVGRSTEEERERVAPAHFDFWENEVKFLRQFTYEHDGCSALVTLDWDPYISRLKVDEAILAPLYTGGTVDMAAFNKLPKLTICSARVEISGKNDLSERAWYPRHFLELALYDSFICANLALPGVLDLFGAKIPASSKNNLPTDLNLSSYNFEFWWVESLRGKFPKLRRLPLKQVREWYALTGIGGRSRAQNGLERAVFCLFHLCRSNNYVDGLIWVFHALEALLETRVGENLSGMLRRISLLIELTDRDRKSLKKHLRRAYDIRSAFVHGGYEIPHPIHSEVIDPEIGKAYGEGLDLQQFGMSLILSLLQQLAHLRASKYHFREVFVPHVGAP